MAYQTAVSAPTAFGRRGVSPRQALRPAEALTDHELFSLFVGSNAEKFEATRDKIHAAGGKSRIVRSWSWPAFLVPQVWLLYRKQWGMALAIIILPMIFAYLIGSRGASGLTIAILMGMWGRSLYVMAAEQKIAKISALGLGAAETRERVRRAGGVSRVAAVIGSIILALCIAIVVLADLQATHLH
jgi:hypothetical protein